MSAARAILRWIAWALRTAIVAVVKSVKYILLALLVFALVMLIGNAGFATKRDLAHRNLHPAATECDPQGGWAILSETFNNETIAIERDPVWARKFSCAVQTHVIPAPADKDGRVTSLRYHLGFLEFKESGSPHPIVERPARSRELSQFDVLKEHLAARPSNMVVAFAHGWRHDARIGNGNVADFRHYLAHMARHLRDRCHFEQRFCGTELTGIYIGWRGARVDEDRIRAVFGEFVGGWFATLSMWITLFDRKPISEEVGPAAVIALRALGGTLDEKRSASTSPERTAGASGPEQRMIVLGHSLGGNMLMTALRDQLIKNVQRHQPGRKFDSPLGDMVVLINPASEAGNWIALQKAVWQRIAYRPSEDAPGSTVWQGHSLFNNQQPPVMLSITAARSWPPSGIWPQDCAWLRLEPRTRREAEAKAKMLPLIASSRGIYAEDVGYDWATHDLFPTFKLDFRPLASTVQRIADRIAAYKRIESGHCPDGAQESEDEVAGQFWRALSLPFSATASILRNVPFMNLDREQTHTIGHYDPPRPSTDALIQRQTLPLKPFGTTHELVGDRDRNSEQPTNYLDIAVADDAACNPAPYWLWRARDIKRAQNGTYWDSNELTALADGRMARPAAHFVHGFINAGMAAITRANDPFWNVRAFDNALSEHGGYMLSSFICALYQFVLDDVAAAPPAPN